MGGAQGGAGKEGYMVGRGWVGAAGCLAGLVMRCIREQCRVGAG